jgi:hypothetical protein
MHTAAQEDAMCDCDATYMAAHCLFAPAIKKQSILFLSNSMHLSIYLLICLIQVIVRATTSDDKQITVCSRPFKEFRQLQTEILANLEDIEESKMAVIPEFPPTFSKSSFGVSLNEMEIVQRVRGVDNWIRAIAKYYPLLSNRSQLFINHFLNLDCLINNEKYEEVIHEQLKAGNVLREGEDDAGSAHVALLATTAEGTGAGKKGKYAAVRQPSDAAGGGGDAAGGGGGGGGGGGSGDGGDGEFPEGEWTVIGGKKEDAPKGCCVIA